MSLDARLGKLERLAHKVPDDVPPPIDYDGLAGTTQEELQRFVTSWQARQQWAERHGLPVLGGPCHSVDWLTSSGADEPDPIEARIAAAERGE